LRVGAIGHEQRRDDVLGRGASQRQVEGAQIRGQPGKSVHAPTISDRAVQSAPVPHGAAGAVVRPLPVSG
jgi:hypothetical protein